MRRNKGLISMRHFIASPWRRESERPCETHELSSRIREAASSAFLDLAGKYKDRDMREIAIAMARAYAGQGQID